MRAVPLLVAALLVLSTPAAAMVAGDPAEPASTGPAVAAQASDPTFENATPNRLALEEPDRRAHVAPAADLSTALATWGVALRNDYETFATRNGFDDLSESERREAIDAALDRVTERTERVRERERQAVADHAAGEVSDGRLIRTLAEIHRESIELDRSLEALADRADAVSGYSISGEMRTLEGLLEVHRSPVRERAATVLREGAPPERAAGVFYLETSEQGLLLSTIDDDDYVREVVRYDNRDRDRDSQFDGIGDVPWSEIYPWILDREDFLPAPDYYSFPGARLYSIDVGHPQGDLHTHLDGGTGEVYREVQRLELEDLPTTAAGTWTGDGLELSIDRTPYDGPIRVAVVDAETNESVRADVGIGAAALGTTDGDSLWVVPPSGDYEVSVRDGDRSANATVPAWDG